MVGAKVAVRPEAWRIGAAVGMSAAVCKVANLGSVFEYVLETELGDLFVVSHDLSHPLAVGQQTVLSLGDHGVSVVRPAG